MAPTQTYDIKLPPLHPAQMQIASALFAPDATGRLAFRPDGPRYIVAACGRRFGKSELGALACAIVASWGGKAWWVGPDTNRAQPGAQAMRRLVRHIPRVIERRTDAKVLEFVFPTGGTIQVRTGNDPQVLRGDSLDFIVMDEAAFMQPEAWYESAYYTLLDRQGRALFISTPYGRNWFYTLYLKGYQEPQAQTVTRDGVIWTQNTYPDPAGREWASYSFSTYHNPYMLPVEIEKGRENTAERTFKQEVMAAFIEDASSVFRGVHLAAEGNALETEPKEGHLYTAGIDWGRVNDFTVFAVMDVNERRIVYYERFNQVDWALQYGRVVNAYRKWKPMLIFGEENAIGYSGVKELTEAGLPIKGFNTNPVSKKLLIESWSLAIERGDVKLPYDGDLINEHLSYEVEMMPSGALRYSAPKGTNDDIVIACALAYSALMSSGPGPAAMARVGVEGLWGSRGAPVPQQRGSMYKHGYSRSK